VPPALLPLPTTLLPPCALCMPMRPSLSRPAHRPTLRLRTVYAWHQRDATRISPFQEIKDDRYGLKKKNAVTFLHQTASRPRAPDAGRSRKSSFLFAWNTGVNSSLLSNSLLCLQHGALLLCLLDYEQPEAWSFDQLSGSPLSTVPLCARLSPCMHIPQPAVNKPPHSLLSAQHSTSMCAPIPLHAHPTTRCQQASPQPTVRSAQYLYVRAYPLACTSHNPPSRSLPTAYCPLITDPLCARLSPCMHIPQPAVNKPPHSLLSAHHRPSMCAPIPLHAHPTAERPPRHQQASPASCLCIAHVRAP
jgi:hypothetical protein